MKRLFFVDLENVGRKFLLGAENLTVEDHICLYTHNNKDGTPKMPPADIVNALKKRGQVEIIQMEQHTKNAMDFQLVCHMGYLVGVNGNYTEYYVVSEDKGYTVAIEYLKHLEKNVRIKQIPNFEEISKNVEQRQKLSVILGKYPPKVVRNTQKAFQKAKTRSEYHTLLTKTVQKDYTEVFQLTRQMFMEEKGETNVSTKCQ